jgi:endonuclease G, mitochondrial
MASLEEAVETQAGAAAERFDERDAQRRANVALLAEPGGVVAANPADRVAKRVDRLGGDPAQAELILEKVINTSDFVGVRYLDAGVAAARAVGRIDIKNAGGQLIGFGTGSLVSSRLVLTNHHVLPDAETAATSAIEFNFQDGIDGQPLQPRLFPLDPGTFFLNDKALDFALVAVRGAPEQLVPFGFNPLIEAEGKGVIGEFATIIQHPKGEKKQVSLRENRIVDLFETFLHYESDTEPGSSGSPVFNDQWELIALHHASKAAADHPELGNFLNEGILIRLIVAFVHEQSLPPAAKALVAGLGSDERAPAIDLSPLGRPAPGSSAPPSPHGNAVEAALTRPEATLTIPLEVSIRLGESTAAAAAPAAPSTNGAAPSTAAPAEPAGVEKITIDPDYSNRQGYDEDFLGTDVKSVSLPTLPAPLLAKAATISTPGMGSGHVLRYHHYSVVLNGERRLAFFTAVNIDGALGQRPDRERDHWFFDPRIRPDQQVGDDVYKNNELDLDRGHLVRRLDPAWGTTAALIKVANDDTFHFTNCTPQTATFNERQTFWAGLEDYILDHSQNLDFKVSVFSGPVFTHDDPPYRGIQIPRSFWKVAVMVKDGGELSATAYAISQEPMLEPLKEAFALGEYRTFQVPVSRIEELTGISFGDLADHDPLSQQESRQESTAVGTLLGRPADIVV